MLPGDTRRKIENITKGIILDGALDNCTSVRNHLSAGFETSTTVKTDFESKSIIKKEQATVLEAYCDQHNLWVTDLPGEDRYLTRGGEAEVYLELAPVSHVAHGKFFRQIFKKPPMENQAELRNKPALLFHSDFHLQIHADVSPVHL